MRAHCYYEHNVAYEQNYARYNKKGCRSCYCICKKKKEKGKITNFLYLIMDMIDGFEAMGIKFHIFISFVMSAFLFILRKSFTRKDQIFSDEKF